MTKKFALYYEMQGISYAILTSTETYLRDVHVLECAGASSIVQLQVSLILDMFRESDTSKCYFPLDEEQKFEEEYMWQRYSIDGYNDYLYDKKSHADIYDEKPILSDEEEQCFLEHCAMQKAIELLDHMPENEDYQNLIVKALTQLLCD